MATGRMEPWAKRGRHHRCTALACPKHVHVGAGSPVGLNAQPRQLVLQMLGKC